MGATSSKKTSAAKSYSTEVVTKIKDLIRSHVLAYFSTTLGLEKDIVNICAAQYYLESRFNVNSQGPVLTNQENRNYIASSAVQKVLKEGSVDQRTNITMASRVLGLGQVSGHYMVRKGAPSGVGEIERLRPDLAQVACINAGEDLNAFYLGEENMSKQILTALIILEDKWNRTKSSGANWVVTGDRNGNVFPSRISGAIGAYLGLGKADSNGTTPVGYATSIVGGAMYAAANGTNPIIYQSSVKSPTAIAAGPATNGVNYAKIATPGCA